MTVSVRDCHYLNIQKSNYKIMKKTLLICGHYPLPEHVGTSMRTMNFVRFFKHLGTIDIAYSNVLPGEENHIRNTIFSNEYFLKKENSPKSFQDRLIRWINIKNRPLPISKYCDDSERQLLSLIESNDYDYIFVRYVINTWNLFKIRSKYKMRTIVDFDDILSGSLSELKISSANGLIRKYRLRLNRKFLIRYENKCLNLGAALFCSERDRERLNGENAISNTFVVPNIYQNNSFEDYRFDDGFEKKNILLFVGTLTYRPNIDGLKWFIESVFPGFKKNYPDAKLFVVGRFPDQEVKDICERNADIELYANVPDIRDYYKQCRAVVVPLLSGGGTRIKILEAALANRPVLSTPVGAEGLDLIDNVDILLFRNAYDFTAKYTKLHDTDHYISLTRNAKHTVLGKYSTSNFNENMRKVLYYLDNRNIHKK